MKTLASLFLSLTVTVSALAQGTVNFTTVSGSNFRAPIYGLTVGEILKYGNDATGIPSGTQTYAGPLIAGSGWTAQLWAAPGAGQSEGSLVASPGATTTFRTGSAAGFVTGITGTLTGVPKDAPSATLQLRVWDNAGGTITSWQAAIFRGASAVFNVNAIGGDINTPPFLFSNGQGGIL